MERQKEAQSPEVSNFAAPNPAYPDRSVASAAAWADAGRSAAEKDWAEGAAVFGSLGLHCGGWCDDLADRLAASGSFVRVALVGSPGRLEAAYWLAYNRVVFDALRSGGFKAEPADRSCVAFPERSRPNKKPSARRMGQLAARSLRRVFG